jgi:low affinity Fe/Cu permease
VKTSPHILISPLRSPPLETTKTMFRQFAERVAVATGTFWAFFGAVAVILAWAASGPIFGFSAQWQLVINSTTTIATFLMVFIIQNTQNRDFKALQLKLDVLLLASRDTHPGLISLHKLKTKTCSAWSKPFTSCAACMTSRRSWARCKARRSPGGESNDSAVRSLQREVKGRDHRHARRARRFRSFPEAAKSTRAYRGVCPRRASERAA